VTSPIRAQASRVEENVRELGLRQPPSWNTLKPADFWELARLLRLKTDHGVASDTSFPLASLASWCEARARAMDPLEVQRL